MRTRSHCVVSAFLGLFFLVGCPPAEAGETQAPPADAAGEPDYAVVHTKTPPRIDGELDDGIWEETTFNDDLLYFSQKMYLKKEKAYPGTSFAVAADERSLYVAVRCDEPNLSRIRKSTHKRDSATFQDDSIELFIDPDRSGDHYFQIALSVTGGLFDTVCINCGARKRNDFNIKGSQSATRINERDWTAELAIPFLGLGVKADNQGLWHLNVCRNTRTVETHLGAVSWGTKGKETKWLGFHDPRIFRTIGGVPRPKYSRSEMEEVKVLRRVWQLDVKPGPKVIAMEPVHKVMYVANNMVVPNWFTSPVRGKEMLKQSTKFFLELPEGVDLLGVGGQGELDSVGLGRFAKNLYAFSVEGEVKHGAGRYTRFKIVPLRLHRTTRVLGPVYLSTSLEAGARRPIYFQAFHDGGKQPLQRSDLLVKTFPTPGMPQKLLAVIHWMSPCDYLAWPGMLDAYARLGFNSIPFNRAFVDQLYPSIRAFLDEARKRGMTVTSGLSAFHRLGRHKESSTVSLSAEKVYRDICPAYRGEYFWKEVDAVASWSAMVAAEYVMLDVECYGHGAVNGWNRRCRRCNDYIEESGLSPKEAMISLGSQIHRVTKQKLTEVFAKAGKKAPPLGWYNAVPGGEVYGDVFRFDDTYKSGDDFANPALYKSMKALVSGERIRHIRALLDAGNVIPHATMGYLDSFGWEVEYPTEWVYDNVLEIYGSGARGIGWFCFQKMEGSDLYYYARAMEAINPVAGLIYDSVPVEGVKASGMYSATAIRKGSSYLILVSEYEDGRSGKVTVTLPTSVSGRLTDLSHKQDLGKVNGRSVVADFRPGVKGAFTALYLIE